MSFTQLSEWSQLENSAQWLWFSDLLCAVGMLGAALFALVHWRRSITGSAPGRLDAIPTYLLYATFATLAYSVYHRWIEVNHFPSQTMPEVLTMFSLALAASQIVLHHALAIHKRSAAWAILDDVLMVIIFGGVLFTHVYLRGLVTAQRDLPPALQSYWFPPHLAALIFSYATLGIAGAICLVYFVTRFWTGVFVGGYSKKSQWLILAALVLVPFAHIVTLPVLALGGLVFGLLVLFKKMPGGEAMKNFERDLDDVSFRAFAVGMPFLTAGLWMGAFWAQEAWANYWGWDSKENSALITWLIYVVYIHLRLLGGYRGEKAMSVLMGGALSVFITFQVFGYLPDSQKSQHRYTDDGVQPREGQQGSPREAQQAALPKDD